MNSFNWSEIRVFNNSQEKAFEELVCQLARNEDIKNKKKFNRKGTPDAGVECYWILKDNKEWGWQAKYFISSFTSSQWNQIDQSVKKALSKHPNLSTYIIALPLDPPDARIKKQKSLLQRWEERVEKWNNWAKVKGMSVEFIPWWSSELIKRLQATKNIGILYFWFNKEEFTGNWFQEQLDKNIADLGPRYNPDLSLKLDLTDIFDGIYRDEKFERQFTEMYDNFLTNFNKTFQSFKLGTREAIIEARDSSQKIINAYEEIDFSENTKIDSEIILKYIKELDGKIYKCVKIIADLREAMKGIKDAAKKVGYYYDILELTEVRNHLDEFKNFILGKTVQLANTPVLILEGDAGMGKSHLIADIAKKRLEKGKLSLILLGQHFVTRENPWTQILKNILRLNCNEREFLGALNSKAQTIGSRIIIYIDALNEGEGKYFWGSQINGFIKTFEKYEWIGLVLSIRSSYVDLIAPKSQICSNIAVRAIHDGFRDVEYEAAELYFNSYGIESPSVPILHPEFQNPLFLKTFCEGLNKSGLTRIPKGYKGLTKIFNFYIDSINKRLSSQNKFNYSSSLNLVRKAINLIIEKKLRKNKKHISFEEATLIIENEIKKYSNEKGFLNALISEGLLIKDLVWNEENKNEEEIRITYDRFEDHLLTSYLLKEYMNENNPKELFMQKGKIFRFMKKKGELFEFIKDEKSCYQNIGILEALSIQLPELTGKELYDLAPHCKNLYPVIESFVKSLSWRNPDTITKKSIGFIKEYVFKYKKTHDLFFDTVFLMNSSPEFLFNAYFLHEILKKLALPDRDENWTIYINDKFYDKSSIKRLIDWAWSPERFGGSSEETIKLTALTISWFLSSSNRYLRDSATTALISLLEDRIPLLTDLLKTFENINDPYIYERLFAVAYGCVLRSDNRNGLKDLSMYVYHTIFENEYVYPHILLRDYAREIIEFSKYLGLDIDIDFSKIRPPYKSEWPTKIPSDEEIKKYIFDYQADDYRDHYWSQNSIIYSMQSEHSGIGHGYGDFGRYVFQVGFINWIDLNPQELSNLAVKRIFEMGYEVEKHGVFDRKTSKQDYSRRGNKPERIGKKYQWMVFHELLAKVSDNFTMYEEYGKRKIKYEGPWEPYVRDFGPSILAKRSQREVYETETMHWWFNVPYDSWKGDFHEWLVEKSSLPDPIKLISVADDSGVEWLVLETSPKWVEPKPLGLDRFSSAHKRLWYIIDSYLISKKEFGKIKKWAKKQNFMGKWLPEFGDKNQLFDREFFWSPAYKYFKREYKEKKPWLPLKGKFTGKTIGNVIVTTENYSWFEEYDCSIEGGVGFLKPSEFVFNGLNMKFGKKEGQLLSKDGDLLCFDPSVHFESLSCLLIRKNELLDFLEKNKLEILWTMVGEKQVVGDNIQEIKGPSRMEISGVYTYKGNRLEGKLNFFSP